MQETIVVAFELLINYIYYLHIYIILFLKIKMFLYLKKKITGCNK